MTDEASQTTQTSDEKHQPDVRNLQDKFHGLLDQRNHFNDLARESHDARNLLNQQRNEKRTELNQHKEKRDAANQVMREHVEKRNAYQDQAKALIADKRGKQGSIERSLPLKVRSLKADIQRLLEKQETSVMDPGKENELVDNVRRMRKELKELEGKLQGQKLAEVDLTDTDKAIDDLFGKADEEHANVVELRNQSNEAHAKFVDCIKELKILQAEADEKHAGFIAYKTKADEMHNKAMELREQVSSIRGEQAADRRARRKEITDLNRAVNQRVNDPKAIEKAKEEQLEALKSGGKISLGF